MLFENIVYFILHLSNTVQDKNIKAEAFKLNKIMQDQGLEKDCCMNIGPSFISKCGRIKSFFIGTDDDLHDLKKHKCANSINNCYNKEILKEEANKCPVFFNRSTCRKKRIKNRCCDRLSQKYIDKQILEIMNMYHDKVRPKKTCKNINDDVCCKNIFGHMKKYHCNNDKLKCDKGYSSHICKSFYSHEMSESDNSIISDSLEETPSNIFKCCKEKEYSNLSTFCNDFCNNNTNSKETNKMCECMLEKIADLNTIYHDKIYEISLKFSKKLKAYFDDILIGIFENLNNKIKEIQKIIIERFIVFLTTMRKINDSKTLQVDTDVDSEIQKNMENVFENGIKEILNILMEAELNNYEDLQVKIDKLTAENGLLSKIETVISGMRLEIEEIYNIIKSYIENEGADLKVPDENISDDKNNDYVDKLMNEAEKMLLALSELYDESKNIISTFIERINEEKDMLTSSMKDQIHREMKEVFNEYNEGLNQSMKTCLICQDVVPAENKEENYKYPEAQTYN